VSHCILNAPPPQPPVSLTSRRGWDRGAPLVPAHSLRSRALPDGPLVGCRGGGTEFLNMQLGWDALPAEQQEPLRNLYATHVHIQGPIRAKLIGTVLQPSRGIHRPSAACCSLNACRPFQSPPESQQNCCNRFRDYYRRHRRRAPESEGPSRPDTVGLVQI
jgi:hypothetical protein